MSSVRYADRPAPERTPQTTYRSFIMSLHVPNRLKTLLAVAGIAIATPFAAHAFGGHDHCGGPMSFVDRCLNCRRKRRYG